MLVDMQLTRSVSETKAKRLSQKQCEQASKDATAGSGFSHQDAAVICGIYADPKLPKYINDNLIVQRCTFGLLAAIISGGCWFLSRQVKQGNAAVAMAARLDRPRS